MDSGLNVNSLQERVLILARSIRSVKGWLTRVSFFCDQKPVTLKKSTLEDVMYLYPSQQCREETPRSTEMADRRDELA